MLLKILLLHLITRRGHTIFVTYISPDLFSCLSLEVDGLVVLSAFVESLLSCLAILWSAFLHVMKLGSTSMITMLLKRSSSSSLCKGENFWRVVPISNFDTYITCSGVPRRLLPVDRALGPPGSDLRACEGFCSEVSVQAQRCFAESEPTFDVSLFGLDVVVTLDVVDELFLRSLPDGLVLGGRRVFPTVCFRKSS